MNIESALKHIIRVGKVTAIYDETGYLQVTFFDRDDEPRDVPMFSFIQEYNMPDIGDNVLCVFIPFAPEGFCLGKWFSNENKPINEINRNVWFKALRKKGSVYFDDTTETLVLNAKNIIINYENITYNGTTNNVNANIIQVGNISQTGDTSSSGTITGSTDVVGGGISLKNHKHGNGNQGADTTAPKS